MYSKDFFSAFSESKMDCKIKTNDMWPSTICFRQPPPSFVRSSARANEGEKLHIWLKDIDAYVRKVFVIHIYSC